MDKSKKTYVFTVVFFVLMIIGLFIWKNISLQNMEKKMEEQHSQMAEKSQRILSSRTTELLRLANIPFVWAVRKEMINGNYDQINEYLIRIIKEPNITQVLVVKSDGTIILATDKKLEGQLFSSVFPKEHIREDEITLYDNESTVRIVAPIMGLNSRLGWLIMIYKPGSPDI